MKQPVAIGIIGDFNPDNHTHLRTNAALEESAQALSVELKLDWLPTPDLDQESAYNALAGYAGLWCSPGSPYKSMSGALKTIQFARQKQVPFLGTCGGFQHAILEYARNVLEIQDADHEESNPYASTLFISKLVCSVFDKTLTVQVKPGSRAHQFIGRDEISEHYYCNFGLNPAFKETIQRGGLEVSGEDADGEVRIIELSGHPFYVGVLFLPQVSSTAEAPHPLILAFLRAASARTAGLRVKATA
ncbi:MAG TPA: CTP synthase [Blastocatellia bacterium]